LTGTKPAPGPSQHMHRPLTEYVEVLCKLVAAVPHHCTIQFGNGSTLACTDTSLQRRALLEGACVERGARGRPK